MNRKILSALVGLAIVACGELSHSSQEDAALATASANPVSALASAAEHLLAPTPLLQDTARTVTRRVWADADLYDVSPDGRFTAQTDWSTGDLAVRDLETGEVRRLTASGESGDAEDAVFSRDGKWVAYSWYDDAEPAYYKLGVVDIEGTNPRIIYRDRATNWIQAEDWSPDGRYVLAYRTVTGGDANESLLISAEDGSARLLKSFPDPSTGGGNRGCFSPDGRYVAYDSWRGDPENKDLFVIDVATGEEHALLVHQADDQMLGWSPDGKHILFRSDRSGTPGAWLLPVTDGMANGDPWLVKPDMWQASGVRFAQDGRYYYKVSTERRDIYVVGFDPERNSVIGSPTAITDRSPGNFGGGIWSPDGRHLAYRDNQGPTDRILVRSMETGDVKEFNLGEPGYVGPLGWTADGRSLVVFVSNPGDTDNRRALYRLDVQTGRKEALSDPLQSYPLVHPRHTSDSGYLLYQLSEENSEGQAAFRILRHDLETGDSTVLFRTPYGAWGQILGAAMSPDGQTLAFGYSPVIGSQPKTLVLLPVTGGEPLELPIEGARGISWMPGGEALLFFRFVAVGPVWEAWYLDLSKGEPQPIGLTVTGRMGLDVHPDGQRITYSSGKGGAELWVMEDFLPTEGSRR